MGKRVVEILFDDLDGTEVEADKIETIRYVFDGTALEIDLIEKNAAKFRKAMEPFIAASRPAENQFTAAKSGGKAKKAGPDAKAARAFWVQSHKDGNPHGLPEPSALGRVPSAVFEAMQKDKK